MNVQEESKESKEMKDTDAMEPQTKAKGEKICSFCGKPPTRHDLCNGCREKVESRSKRQVAQKFERSGECGCVFTAFLCHCINFGLNPEKLCFFTTLSLVNHVFPVWHLRHASDQRFEDERGTVNSRWNLPNSHTEKVFVNLYKKMKENPILDGTEYSINRRFSRNEINRILEQKLEQLLKDFGKLHQFSFCGNAYCGNDNNNNNNDNNTSEKPTINGRSEEDGNMESNPQSRHSISNERSNSNDNNSGVNNGLLCESRRSFFTPTISTHYISNNNNNNNNNDNNNSMSNNANGNIMNNAGITEGVNPFSFGLDMAPYVPRISYIQSNESNLMERENGQNGCGLSYSAPVSPMMRVQPSRMGRMTSMSTGPLPSIPQEAPIFLNGQVPIGSFEQNFANVGGFAQNMRLTNNNQSNNNDNNRNNNNNNDNNNYFGSITPTLIPQVIPQVIVQNDGNGFENAYSSSNDESQSYDSSDGSEASQGMVSRNSSVNGTNSNNYNGNIGNMDFAWETSSFVSFGGSTMDWNGNFSNNDMSSLNSLNFNDNSSMISAPFGYHAIRGTQANSPVVSSNEMNDNNNNNSNSPLPQFEQLPNYFHDLRDGDMI